jgi:hypothetical protein
MVKCLEARLAAGVNLTFVGWEVRVTLNHLRPAFHHPNDYTFARRAGTAQTGVPVIVPSDQIFRQSDRALDLQFSFTDAKALTGYGSHRAQAGPSKEISPG